MVLENTFCSSGLNGVIKFQLVDGWLLKAVRTRKVAKRRGYREGCCGMLHGVNKLSMNECCLNSNFSTVDVGAQPGRVAFHHFYCAVMCLKAHQIAIRYTFNNYLANKTLNIRQNGFWFLTHFFSLLYIRTTFFRLCVCRFMPRKSGVEGSYELFKPSLMVFVPDGGWGVFSLSSILLYSLPLKVSVSMWKMVMPCFYTLFIS